MSELPDWQTEFVRAVEERAGRTASAFVVAAVRWAAAQGLGVTRQPPNVSGGVGLLGGLPETGDATLFAVFETGRLAMQLDSVRRHQPFSIAEQEAALRQQLRDLGFDAEKRDYPDVSLVDLAREDSAFFLVIASVVKRLRRTSGTLEA